MHDEQETFPEEERTINPAARRALKEAQLRRQLMDRKNAERPREIGARPGPEPTRYQDWEVKGLASDF